MSKTRREISALSTFSFGFDCWDLLRSGQDLDDAERSGLARWQHSHELIQSGDNPIDVMAYFLSMDNAEVSNILGVSEGACEAFLSGRDCSDLTGQQVIDFCLATKIHPVELISKQIVDVSTPLLDAVLVVANHSMMLVRDREYAQDFLEVQELRFQSIPEVQSRVFSAADSFSSNLRSLWTELALHSYMKGNSLTDVSLGLVSDMDSKDCAAARVANLRDVVSDAFNMHSEASKDSIRMKRVCDLYLSRVPVDEQDEFLVRSIKKQLPDINSAVDMYAQIKEFHKEVQLLSGGGEMDEARRDMLCLYRNHVRASLYQIESEDGFLEMSEEDVIAYYGDWLAQDDVHIENDTVNDGPMFTGNEWGDPKNFNPL